MPDYKRAFNELVAEIRKAANNVGQLADRDDKEKLAYLLGCSETWERALEDEGVG